MKKNREAMRKQLKDELRTEIKTEIQSEIEQEIKSKYVKKEATTSSSDISDAENEEENKASDQNSPEMLYSTEGLGTEKRSRKKRSCIIPKKLYKQIQSCESNCCNHKQILDYLDKAVKTQGSFISSQNPDMATEDSINDSV